MCHRTKRMWSQNFSWLTVGYCDILRHIYCLVRGLGRSVQGQEGKGVSTYLEITITDQILRDGNGEGLRHARVERELFLKPPRLHIARILDLDQPVGDHFHSDQFPGQVGPKSPECTSGFVLHALELLYEFSSKFKAVLERGYVPFIRSSIPATLPFEGFEVRNLFPWGVARKVEDGFLGGIVDEDEVRLREIGVAKRWF